MNKSLWTATTTNKVCDSLNKNLEADILIIGGGITGISCCYQLSDLNKKIILVEANEIGSGVTSKTTGKITYLQGNYHKIEEKCGFKICEEYYHSQIEAINMLKRIIKEHNIKCNLEESNSYLFTTDEDKKIILEKEYQILKQLNAPINTITDPRSAYTIRGEKNYTFHPLKYIYELKNILLKRNIEIYENTRILSISKQDNIFLCKTKTAYIKAKKVIIASHYPYFLKPFLMPIKVTLEKSYIAASHNKKFNYNALSIDKTPISLRNYTDNKASYKIFLCGSHNIALNNNNQYHFKKLKQKLNDYEYIWSNIDIITGDYIPLIGEIDNNLFLATGYNTWGMTNSTLASIIMKDLIIGKHNKYEKVTDPNRNSGSKYLKAIFSSIKSFSEELFFYDKSWYQGKVKKSTKDGVGILIYEDINGIEHAVKSQCPHLKCGLIWNEEEKTWDCPCHGSRFNIDGKCIEGPSNYDITI